MRKNIVELQNKFLNIKQQGWIKTVTNGNAGVGITFEKLVGVTNNNFEIPDFNGIEIKAKREASHSYITLFSATPDGPHFHEVERLKDLYGYPHSKQKQYKVLNNAVFGNIYSKIGLNYYFKLEVNKNEQKIFLLIFDKKGNPIEDEVFWYFDTLKEKLNRKFRMLALIKAHNKRIDNTEYFKYHKMTIYALRDFETFVNLIETGNIRVAFKINAFLSGPKKGKICDHGTSFEIKEADLTKLFTIYEETA